MVGFIISALKPISAVQIYPLEGHLFFPNHCKYLQGGNYFLLIFLSSVPNTVSNTEKILINIC